MVMKLRCNFVVLPGASFGSRRTTVASTPCHFVDDSRRRRLVCQAYIAAERKGSDVEGHSSCEGEERVVVCGIAMGVGEKDDNVSVAAEVLAGVEEGFPSVAGSAVDGVRSEDDVGRRPKRLDMVAPSEDPGRDTLNVVPFKVAPQEGDHLRVAVGRDDLRPRSCHGDGREAPGSGAELDPDLLMPSTWRRRNVRC